MQNLKEQAEQQPRGLSKHLKTKTKSKKVVSCLCCWALLPELVLPALPSSAPDTDYRVHTLVVTNSSSALRELSIREKNGSNAQPLKSKSSENTTSPQL